MGWPGQKGGPGAERSVCWGPERMKVDADNRRLLGEGGGFGWRGVEGWGEKAYNYN